VEAERVVVRAPLVLICPGPDYDTLPPEVRPRREGLTRCRLQMLRVRPPYARRYRPTLLTGLSLLRYPAFTAQPGFDLVRKRIESERPELVAAGIHLIIAQLPGGDLIVGDTHDYADTVSPFSEERLDRLVLEEAGRFLGVARLEVRERWHGVYPSAPGDPFLVADPMPGVRLVQTVSGIGMTTALGLAARVLDELVDGSGAAGPPGTDLDGSRAAGPPGTDVAGSRAAGPPGTQLPEEATDAPRAAAAVALDAAPLPNEEARAGCGS
jgi:FAD dependent oxidoreductase TIGR03364